MVLTPGEINPGTYDLFLQSFDDNGSIKSTLKEDHIEVTVVWRFTRDQILTSAIEVKQLDVVDLSIDHIR